mmetsp:Transcript_4980/g.15969  ORF Transcript_4980/g.15969 Transcript_4980/m.15969 type:complete len:207 (+) Transcript_4980:3514-4134(+)
MFGRRRPARFICCALVLCRTREKARQPDLQLVAGPSLETFQRRGDFRGSVRAHHAQIVWIHRQREASGRVGGQIGPAIPGSLASGFCKTGARHFVLHLSAQDFREGVQEVHRVVENVRGVPVRRQDDAELPVDVCQDETRGKIDRVQTVHRRVRREDVRSARREGGSVQRLRQSRREGRGRSHTGGERRGGRRSRNARRRREEARR